MVLTARNDRPVSSNEKLERCLYAKHADVNIPKLSEKSNKNSILLLSYPISIYIFSKNLNRLLLDTSLMIEKNIL